MALARALAAARRPLAHARARGYRQDGAPVCTITVRVLICRACELDSIGGASPEFTLSHVLPIYDAPVYFYGKAGEPV